MLRSIWRAGEDEIHVAAGVGLVLSGLQIDVAVDFSDSIDVLSLSAIRQLTQPGRPNRGESSAVAV